MAYKAINEKFPPEVWEEINCIKTDCNMTWQEFLPYAAKCAERCGMSKKTYERLCKCMGCGIPMEEIVTTLLDFWEEEGDDGK